MKFRFKDNLKDRFIIDKDKDWDLILKSYEDMLEDIEDILLDVDMLLDVDGKDRAFMLLDVDGKDRAFEHEFKMKLDEMKLDDLSSHDLISQIVRETERMERIESADNDNIIAVISQIVRNLDVIPQIVRYMERDKQLNLDKQIFVDYSRDSLILVVCMFSSMCILLSSLTWDGLDDVSLNLIYLTCILIPICMLCDSEYNRYNSMVYLLLECIIIGLFVCNDLLLFFILFEGVLIPMFLLLGVLGRSSRRSRAGMRLLLYTILGSIWFLLGILFILIECGGILDIDLLSIIEMDSDIRSMVWCLILGGMMVKIPLMPVHLWLGEAHVEASTGGSVLLAGVLLKLGGYGLMKLNVSMLGGGGESVIEILNILCIQGVIMAGFISIRQTDMKRIIAYGSISHMSLLVLGILSGVLEGYIGGLIQMVSHGLVSSGLFICTGIIYNRIGSREINYISGLLELMPLLGLLMNMCVLGNIALPGTSSFVGEFYSLMGIISENRINGILTSSTMVIGVSYSLWLYNRGMFGGLSKVIKSDVEDLNLRETIVLIVLVMLMLVIGIYPDIIRLDL